ncbi:MAG: hydrogenase maturation protease [Bacteroidetes bacterium]|nr:hydrogenase maturation protease [Bacteroidota bacterium]MCW5896166.1 hydrogenase maturation protease [Bacteroidota bacterium]
MQQSKTPSARKTTSTRKARSLLVIGVGNEYRSDDGLGICVLRTLRRRMSNDMRMIELSGEGTSLMSAWREAEHVLIIDAVVSGGPAGMLHRLDARRDRIPKYLFHSSSHTFGVGDAIELARELDELPQSLILYGLEGESFEAGVGLSESVVRMVPDLIHLVERDIERLLRAE